MVRVAQTSEVVEDYHLLISPGENIVQVLADGFEDADLRLFFDPRGKRFLDFSGFASTNPETRGWLQGCGLARASRRARQVLP